MTEQKSLFPKLDVFSLPSPGRSSEGFFHLSTFKAGSTLRETSENWALPFQKWKVFTLKTVKDLLNLADAEEEMESLQM